MWKVPAAFDDTQLPVAVGVDLPGLEAETTLTPEQRAALASDLA